MNNPSIEHIQSIDIDDETCIRCRVCCPGGCAEAPSIFVEPDGDGVPALHWPRDDWNEAEVLDAVYGCPTGAISVNYETYRITANGVESIDSAQSAGQATSRFVLVTHQCHLSTNWDGGLVDEKLAFSVRDAVFGGIIYECFGWRRRRRDKSQAVIARDGPQYAELSADGTQLVVKTADDEVETVAIEPLNARQWRVDSTERCVGSAQCEHCYEITMRVIDNSTDRVMFDFRGSHSRSPMSKEIYRSEGVQSVELSPEGTGIIIFTAGERPERVSLRGDPGVEGCAGEY